MNYQHKKFSVAMNATSQDFRDRWDRAFANEKPVEDLPNGREFQVVLPASLVRWLIEEATTGIPCEELDLARTLLAEAEKAIK